MQALATPTSRVSHVAFTAVAHAARACLTWAQFPHRPSLLAVPLNPSTWGPLGMASQILMHQLMLYLQLGPLISTAELKMEETYLQPRRLCKGPAPPQRCSSIGCLACPLRSGEQTSQDVRGVRAGSGEPGQ